MGEGDKKEGDKKEGDKEEDKVDKAKQLVALEKLAAAGTKYD